MKALTTLLPLAVLTAASAPALAQERIDTTRPIPGILQPAPEPASFPFSPRRPRVVVLLHGVTNRPTSAPEEHIATSGHARWYWGYDLIAALMGTPDAQNSRLIQHTQGRTGFSVVDGKQWNYQNFSLPVTQTDLAPVLVPNNGQSETDARRYISATFRPSDNPSTAVMVTFRDGSRHMMQQVGDAIEQIYQTYNRTFGHLPAASQPQIYLVGHSFGGIVSRAILTNPEGADLYGGKLTSAQRQQADFLRKRVVLVTTMSTPHTGSEIPELAGDMDKLMKTGRAVLPSASDLKKQTGLAKVLPDVLTAKLVELREDLTGAIKSAAGDRPCLQDIQRMAEYNRGILAPAKATRPDGSLVPIYTLGGRNPGGLFMDRDRAPFLTGGRMLPHSFLDVMGSGRFSSDAGSLFLIESILHRGGYGKENTRPWGKARIPEADLISSPNRGTGTGLSSTQMADRSKFIFGPGLAAGVLSDAFSANPYTFGADGENDTDGFCGFDSSHGLEVSPVHPNWWKGLYGARYGSIMPWDMDNHGSLMFNVGNGLYIYNDIVSKAGPVATGTNSDLSVWSPGTAQSVGKHNIRVEITRVWSRDGEIDSGTSNMKKGDYDVYVRVAGNLKKFSGKDNQDPFLNVGVHSINNTPQSVIPIVFSVIDRDDFSPDDYGALSPYKGRDNVYVYFDTRTGRIFGDATGKAGEEITVGGYKGVYNPTGIGFRITGN